MRQAAFFGIGSFRFSVTAWKGDDTLENVTASVMVDVMCVSFESARALPRHIMTSLSRFCNS